MAGELYLALQLPCPQRLGIAAGDFTMI